jgi:hypothetical protein
MNKPSKLVAASVSPAGAAAPSRFIPCGPSEGFGTRGRCTVCGHGFYGCVCDVPDIDVPHVSDMKRIMPRLFDDDSGWAKAERSALGMAK